jgi:hypothetical protein
VIALEPLDTGANVMPASAAAARAASPLKPLPPDVEELRAAAQRSPALSPFGSARSGKAWA